ncbi:DUF938 domain-containing protein [Albimonas pacifica]|uniref:SAM-dependent methyltransferase n=1 Tax=Albimonas pacifica TaxID=1114924 RepID=A0A1I3LNB4_9RHOB|nr:DUF938 domain-containing protein [Albimonas pacifica]SFI86254.1 Protein of unknown function [Albimonas pacifica]
MTEPAPQDPARSRPGYEDETAERLVAPAALRNAGPIAEMLTQVLADEAGPLLEIGAGPGQHAVAGAEALPRITWIPSDPDPLHLKSIRAWRAHAGLANLAEPMRLDATDDWAAATALSHGPLRAVFCANVIHIAPWRVAEGLVAGAARALGGGGRLILYGPFLETEGAAPSNLAFHRSLQERDPEWGVRPLADVVALAALHQLALERRIEMPANNLALVFRR